MEVAGWPLQVPIWRLAVRSLVGGATFLTFVLASDGELRQRAMALLHRKPPAES